MAANKKILNILAVCFFVFCVSVTGSYAGTCWNGGSSGSAPWDVLDGAGGSPSCAYADVNYCVNTVAGTGETVNIPAGDCTWANTLVVTNDIRLIGAGTGSTNLTSNLSSNLFYGLIRYIPGTPNVDHRFRISGVTFLCDDKSNGVSIYNDSATAEYIRIDNNQFLNPGGVAARRCILVNGTVFGVIDNNTFDNLDDGASYDSAIAFYGTGAKLGKTQWDALNATLAFGGSDNLFFEDNTITSSHGNIIFHGQGGRSVIRYNTFGPATGNMLALIDIHGNQSTTTPTNYGTMISEIYGNDIDCNTYGGYITDHRGGRVMVFNNALTNASRAVYAGKVREEFNDATIPEANPYTQRVNNSYYWGNRDDGAILSTFLTDQCSSDGCGYTIDENTDWWTERTGAFDGTGNVAAGGGCGTGTLADRPITCTTGVGYWVTNQSCSDLTGMVGANPTTPISGTLYRCTSTNTWTECFTPYTYPHPLRQPQSPTDLRVVSGTTCGTSINK
jgi:hypothetical protein